MTTIVLQNMCQKIIYGGQTGVDRGALDACLESDFPTGGWCPKGRLAEDGIIDRKYPLKETPEINYSFRTQRNVTDSDATLILADKKLSGGSLLTYECAIKLKKPVLVLIYKELLKEQIVNNIIKWITENNIVILNVAGQRESEWDKGYYFSKQLIKSLILEENRLNSQAKQEPQM